MAQFMNNSSSMAHQQAPKYMDANCMPYPVHDMYNNHQFAMPHHQMRSAAPMFYGPPPPTHVQHSPMQPPVYLHRYAPVAQDKWDGPHWEEETSTLPPNSPPGLDSPWSSVPSPQDEVSTAFDSNEWNHPSLLSSPTVSRFNGNGPMGRSPYGHATAHYYPTSKSASPVDSYNRAVQRSLQNGNQRCHSPKVVEKRSHQAGTDVCPPAGKEGQSKRGKIVTAASNGQLYKTKLCYYHVHGTCSWGASCHHAHSLEELRPKPDLTKTSMCPKLGECRRKNCPYAHSREELRSTECFAKTKVCFGSCENCRFGGNCRYAHSVKELKSSKTLPTKIMANIKGKKKAPPLQTLKEGDAKRGIKLIHSKAKGDFDAETYGNGYIDLEEGDYVAIVKDDEDGWMYGKNFSQDTIGWFPTSYVVDDDEELDVNRGGNRDETNNPDYMVAPQFYACVPVAE